MIPYNMSDSDEIDEFDEINQLIENCKKIDSYVNESYEPLYRLKHSYMDMEYYGTLLDEAHKKALDNIKKTGKSNFTPLLKFENDENVKQ